MTEKETKKTKKTAEKAVETVETTTETAEIVEETVEVVHGTEEEAVADVEVEEEVLVDEQPRGKREARSKRRRVENN